MHSEVPCARGLRILEKASRRTASPWSCAYRLSAGEYRRALHAVIDPIGLISRPFHLEERQGFR
jgi:hypothetical protein